MTCQKKKYNTKKLSNSSTRACGSYSLPDEGLHNVFAWISQASNEPTSPACPGPSLQQFFLWMFFLHFGAIYKPAICDTLQLVLHLDSSGNPVVDTSSWILYCWSNRLTEQPSFNPSYHPLIQSIAHHFDWDYSEVKHHHFALDHRHSFHIVKSN